MRQQSKASMLALSVVPKLKMLPIIGIMGLLIVSILIYRDSLFLEQGLPNSGDFNFPFADIFVKRNLVLWNENGMDFQGVWQLPRWLILDGISSLIGEQFYVYLGLALAHFVPGLVGGSVVYYLLNQRNLLDNRVKKEAAFFIAGLACISAPIITNVGGIRFFGNGYISEVMIAYPLFVYAILSTKRMLLRTLIIFACVIVTFGGSPREMIYYIFLVIPPIVVLLIVDRRKLVNSLVNVGKLVPLVISISAFGWLPLALDIESFRPAYTADESTLGFGSLELLSQNQELANSFRGLEKWWSVVNFSTENQVLRYAWFISSWAIPILAFSSLIIIRETAMRKVVVVLGALSVIVLFLVKGANPPFGEFYSWLLLEAQLPFGLNWMFREPAKFYNFFALPIAFLLVIVVLRIISPWKVKGQTVAVIAVMICLVLYAWPLYTGNFKGTFHLTERPEEYLAIRELLDGTEGNILWVPPSLQGQFVWQKTSLARDPISTLSPNPFFSMQFQQKELWNDIQIGLRQDQDSLLKYLETIGVRYIVLRNDMQLNSTVTVETLRRFESFVSNVGANEIYSGKYLRAFQLPSNMSYIYAYPHMVNKPVVDRIELGEFNFESESDYKTLSSPNFHWKKVLLPVIEVDPDQVYFVESRIKAWDVHQAYIRIVEADANKDVLSANYFQGIGDGPFDWKTIRDEYFPSSNLVRYVQFEIWYRYSSDKPVSDEISIDFFRYGNLKFNGQFYEQQALSYKKVDDTKYIVNIPNSLEQHIIVFPQFFNSLWIAKIDGKEYEPSSIYNSLNAFVVDKGGTMEITYKPQQLFYPALLVSLASVGTAIAFSIYEWRRISRGKSMLKSSWH